MSWPATGSMCMSSGTLCCANRADAPVTTLNPALPGETIYFFATGLGVVCGPQDIDPLNNCLEGDAAKAGLITGAAYTGPLRNVPLVPVNSTVGGGSSPVVGEAAVPGSIGLYRVSIRCNSRSHKLGGVASAPRATLASKSPSPARRTVRVLLW